MTNKPMLSVEQELLEEMLAAMKETYSLPAKFYGSTLGDRVRALLDSNPEENGPCPKCGGSLITWGCTCDPRWPSYKPAAQHQGEPVACVITFREGAKEPELLSWNQLPVGEHQLYTEQPAPVALVMPERKGVSHKDWREWTKEEISYNKALDDVARLNGVKP